jgi:soluble lytic murein transglycosylase
MQKLGRTLALLGSARALLAGAAILAGAAGPVGGKSGSDTADDVALAIPRLSMPNGTAPVALPQPLAPSDALRVRRIFASQAKNDIPAAVAECEQLTDAMLLPHILADRYLGGSNRSKPDELISWLARYPDLPDAPAIHALLASEAPTEAGRLATPVPMPPLPTIASNDDVDPTERLLARNRALDRSVRETARANPDRALRLIARTRGLDRLYGAQLRAEVAQILFTQGRDTEALSIAQAAHHQAGGEIGLAPFIAGLAAWRIDQPETAKTLFEAAFKARLIQPGRRTGAAFWAARTHLRLREDREYAPWLRRAAENGQTFYGLLARRALGQPLSPEPDVDRPTLGDADVDAIDATPAGHRAFALLQVGQDSRAAAELQLLWSQTRDKPGFTRSIMLVARQAGLTTLASQLASLFEPASVHLPSRRLRPTGGFRTDPALLYALVRLESNFDPHAVSPAGARGLMQLMPGTIDFILGRARTRRPHDPGGSLDLGQRYLLMLAQYDLIGGDLIRLLASYNSGPGSLGKWIGAVRHNGDPLLFIESVPNDETRNYLPRALAYTWLYAAELKLPSPSLDELAAGSWPRFDQDGPATSVIARLQ